MGVREIIARLANRFSEPHGLSDSIAELVGLPGVANGKYPLQIDRDGAWVRFPSGVELAYGNAFNSITDIALTTGDFESTELRVFESYVRPASVVLDVGANVGLYALSAAKIGADVYAFEPVPETCAIMRRNVARQASSITVVNSAVGAADGTVHITADFHSSNYLTDSGSPEHTVAVPCVRIDTYCSSLPNVDLIKIDVEGRELDVLLGAKETLARFKPTLLVEIMERPSEFHDRIAQPVVDTLAYMREQGYSWSVIDDDCQLVPGDSFDMSDSPIPFHNYLFFHEEEATS